MLKEKEGIKDKSNKSGFIVGSIILLLLSGLGFGILSSLKNSDIFDDIKVREPVVQEFLKAQSQKNVPEFLMNQEDNKVVTLKPSQIATGDVLVSDTAYFLFFDKLLISYYLSYKGPDYEKVIASIAEGTQYPPEAIEVLSYNEAKKYYKKVLEDFESNKKNTTINGYLENPNDIKAIVKDYLVYVDFVFEKPEHLNVAILGLGAYLDFASKTPTEEMLKNPDSNMCTLAKVHPDMRHLPEELECDF